MTQTVGIEVLSQRTDFVFAGQFPRELVRLPNFSSASDLERIAYLLAPLAAELATNMQPHPLGEALQRSLKGERKHAFRGIVLPRDPDGQSCLKPYRNIRGFLNNLDRHGVDLAAEMKINMSLDDPRRALAHSLPQGENQLGLVLVYDRSGLDSPYDPDCDLQRNEVYLIPPYTFKDLYMGTFYYLVS